MATLETRIIEFSLNLFHTLASDDQTENVFMSPVSIALVLYMVYMGADGNTAKQMRKSLKLEDKRREDIPHTTKQMMDTMACDGNVSGYLLTVANKLYPSVGKGILDDFIKEVTEYFNTEVEQLDFTTKPEESRQLINTWTQTATHDKIKDLIGPDIITPQTAMILVNAIYFKGDWKDKFLPDRTTKEDFTLINGQTSPVLMMHKNFEKAMYGQDESLACKVLQLPYSGDQISMVIILPDSHEGLTDLEQKLTAPILRELITNMRQKEVNVDLPKFKVESSFQLADQLSRLGMPDLFDERMANLSKMSKEQLHVSHVIHKAFIEVNEEGSEAAAATGVSITLCCYIPPMEFKAKHPFIYMIWDNRSNLPLFMGRMMKPPSDSQI